MQTRETAVTPEQAGARLDRYLAEAFPDLSRSLAQRLVETGRVLVDGRPAKSSAKVSAGQSIQVTFPEPEPVGIQPQPIPLNVVYEDADLIVIDKPAGLVVHPAAGHAHGTLVNAILARCPDIVIGTSLRPGIVHRLDKDTSGLMVVAKNDVAQASLARQIKDHEVLKEYLALVHGHLTAQRGTIEAPIGRDPRNRKKMAIVEYGRPAVTHFTVSERFTDYDLLDVRLETGRTHQIRVHLASIGHPIAGDAVYGHADTALGLTRQFLHAHRLGFQHPRAGDYREYTSPLPDELRAVLASLRITA